MTEAPCKVCRDNSCHGCQIASGKRNMLWFARAAYQLTEQTPSEGDVQSLLDAGVLNEEEARELLDGLCYITHHSTELRKLCERAFAFDIFQTASESDQ